MSVLSIFSKNNSSQAKPDIDAVDKQVDVGDEQLSDLAITKDTNIAELATAYPHLAEVLAEDYGLHCVGCFASAFDSIESGAQLHGMNESEIDEMVKRLKKLHKTHLDKIA